MCITQPQPVSNSSSQQQQPQQLPQQQQQQQRDPESRQLAIYDTILTVSQAHHAHCAYTEEKTRNIVRTPIPVVSFFIQIIDEEIYLLPLFIVFSRLRRL